MNCLMFRTFLVCMVVVHSVLFGGQVSLAENLCAKIPVFSELVTVSSGELSGLAIFKNGVALADQFTNLSVGLFLPLNATLGLNKGAVSLTNDLTLAGPFTLSSSGSISGNNHTIFLTSATNINGNVNVISNLTIDGNNNSVIFLPSIPCYANDNPWTALQIGSHLVVNDGVILTLKNLTINSFNSILCLGASSQIILDNVNVNLDEDSVIGRGSLVIHRAVISGPHTVVVETSIPSVITKHGQLHFVGYAKLHFNASALAINRYLLNGVDSTSTLWLDHGSVLSSDVPGLIFDTGTILVDNDVAIISSNYLNSDAVALSLVNPARTRESTMKVLGAAKLVLHGKVIDR